MTAERAMVRLAASAMGTRFEIALWGEDDVLLRAVGEECLREVEHWHGRLSRFAPDSDTARLSRDPEASVDAELAQLLALCEHVREASDGAFDPWYAFGALGKASAESTEDTKRNTEATEKAEETESAGPEGGSTQSTSSSSVPSVRTSVTSVDPAVSVRKASLDFGAVGKGWALDRITSILREHGVTTALVHGGTSSVAAVGSPPGADGWRVDVRSAGVPLRRVLRDQAMGVSAPRGRVDAADCGHIVNPRNGHAAALVDTAVVIGPAGAPHAAALCDAWSTALVVLGEQETHATGIKLPAPPPLPSDFEAYIHTSQGWHNLTPIPTPTRTGVP